MAVTLQRWNVALGTPVPSTRRSGAVSVPTPERSPLYTSVEGTSFRLGCRNRKRSPPPLFPGSAAILASISAGETPTLPGGGERLPGIQTPKDGKLFVTANPIISLKFHIPVTGYRLPGRYDDFSGLLGLVYNVERRRVGTIIFRII